MRGAGRALQAVGLFAMLGALIYGVQTDDLGGELLGALFGLAFVLIGRNLQARADARG
ncbi:MAG: hypothetical protein K8T90_00635 [Planctomycetes bacterium]|nr:hypothetical protein [Planctomycetota bacterium]